MTWVELAIIGAFALVAGMMVITLIAVMVDWLGTGHEK
jgi:hypothetical protein